VQQCWPHLIHTVTALVIPPTCLFAGFGKNHVRFRPLSFASKAPVKDQPLPSHTSTLGTKRNGVCWSGRYAKVLGYRKCKKSKDGTQLYVNKFLPKKHNTVYVHSHAWYWPAAERCLLHQISLSGFVVVFILLVTFLRGCLTHLFVPLYSISSSSCHTLTVLR
jgi:hypothetical protein